MIVSGRGRGPQLRTRAAEVPPRQHLFSAFINEDLERARDLAGRLIDIANTKGGDAGLADAIAAAEQALGTEMPGLVQYAVELFVTHYPPARGKFPLKPL